MEEANKKLADQFEKTNRDHSAAMKQLLDKYDDLSRHVESGRESVGSKREEYDWPPPPKDERQAIDPESPVPDYTEGQHFPLSLPLGVVAPTTAPKGRKGRSPLTGSFGPGFLFETEDEQFKLQIHYESQIETRLWGQRDQVPANSGFYLPRQRIFFNGNITQPIEYEFSINRGFGNLNLLNAYINVHLDDRLEVRFGRFFTPLFYDQYAISNYWLPTPERSVYTTNLSLNRQFGLMGWGYLFDKRLDYAAGVFNGSRNSFEPLHNGVDIVGYMNARPFQSSQSLPALKFLNFGSSVTYGYQDQTPVPLSFRIGGGSPNSDVPGPGTVPFLILNRDVVERGARLMGSVHAAYFYKSLSLIGEWQYGYGGYATASRPSSIQVPFSGFYATAGYFLTGEHVERRTRVTPLRPFIPLRKGEGRGPGAWELTSRVSELRLGENVFTAGFANPDQWSNKALTTEVGLNWYWNDYVKIYMFWLHGEFGDPVLYRPGGYQKTADMFWLRFQLYF